ncbi:MAG: NlpC/P60 family protein [Spirochaetota bacterium]
MRISKYKLLTSLFVIAGLCLFGSRSLPADENTKGISYLVSVPVTDLRREPQLPSLKNASALPYEADELEESQLIYGEEVLVFGTKGKWSRVEAVEQLQYFRRSRWEGYPGWVQTKHLALKPANYKTNAIIIKRYAKFFENDSETSTYKEVPLGARLPVIARDGIMVCVRKVGGGKAWVPMNDIRVMAKKITDENILRDNIIKTALQFVDEPYFWGGRAGHRPYDKEHPSGVDCSGLVDLAFRANGVNIPRDAGEQFMKCRQITYPEIKPGDLVFLAKKDDPKKITHVMIFTGGDSAIEATMDVNRVRIITFKEKIGKALKDVSSGQLVGDRYVYMGRILN